MPSPIVHIRRNSRNSRRFCGRRVARNVQYRLPSQATTVATAELIAFASNG